MFYFYISAHHGTAVFSRLSGSSAQTVLLSTLLHIFTFSFYTHNVCTDYLRQKNTFGHRYTNLLQDTLSTNPTWPLEILRNTEENKRHLNNPMRRKKHRGKHAGIRNRREKAHSPPLPSILLANVQSLDNKMDDLRARMSFNGT